MTEHNLKTWPEYWQAVRDGTKTFEIRQNDRGFKAGDRLILQEWEPGREAYTGRYLAVEVTYITTFQQKTGFVVLGIRKTSP